MSSSLPPYTAVTRVMNIPDLFNLIKSYNNEKLKYCVTCDEVFKLTKTTKIRCVDCDGHVCSNKDCGHYDHHDDEFRCHDCHEEHEQNRDSDSDDDE